LRIIEYHLGNLLEKVNGKLSIKNFDFPLDLESYTDLCNKIPVSNSWFFIIHIDIPGYNKIEKLAYFGYRSPLMYSHMGNIGSPSIYWSSKNMYGYTTWIKDDMTNSPYCSEMTTEQGAGDSWVIQKTNGDFEKLSTSELGQKISDSLFRLVAGQ
jgi:hypothetical protein